MHLCVQISRCGLYCFFLGMGFLSFSLLILHRINCAFLLTLYSRVWEGSLMACGSRRPGHPKVGKKAIENPDSILPSLPYLLLLLWGNHRIVVFSNSEVIVQVWKSGSSHNNLSCVSFRLFSVGRI